MDDWASGAGHWLGSHALTGFLLLQAVLWALVALGHAVLRRIAVPGADSTLPPVAFLAVRVALGFGIVVFTAMGFAEVAEQLRADDRLQRFDDAFMRALRHAVPLGAVVAFAFVTRLGDPPTLVVLAVVVAGLLVWRGRPRMALAWLLALGGNALLNPLLKQVFERVRPLHDEALVAAHGFSFPSGHSSGAVVAYGMLAYVLARRLPARTHLPLALAAATLAFAIGASRVFLQVHFPSDVLAGFCTGALWLAVCITSVELLAHYHRRPG
jgi:undecaprenyl-diphosphatase